MGIFSKKKNNEVVRVDSASPEFVAAAKSKGAQMPSSGRSEEGGDDDGGDSDDELVVYADDLTISKYISKAWSGDSRMQSKSA